MKATEENLLTAQEIDARREAGLKKLLATPPKPHKPLNAVDKQSKEKPAK